MVPNVASLKVTSLTLDGTGRMGKILRLISINMTYPVCLFRLIGRQLFFFDDTAPNRVAIVNNM